jgi:hypothetical protein
MSDLKQAPNLEIVDLSHCSMYHATIVIKDTNSDVSMCEIFKDCILSEKHAGDHVRPKEKKVTFEDEFIASYTQPSSDHYRKHPSGVECITVAEHFNFNLGNVLKYVWRAGHKENELDDLTKAQYYIEREIIRLKTKSLQ